jgi:hypothetical protein
MLQIVLELLLAFSTTDVVGLGCCKPKNTLSKQPEWFDELD